MFIKKLAGTAVAALTALTAVTSVYATGNTVPEPDAANNGKTSITVHKMKMSDTNFKVVGDGEELADKPGELLKGAVFRLRKVKQIGNCDISKLDFLTNDSFVSIAENTDGNGQPTGDVTLEKDDVFKPQLSDGSAEYTFSNLKYGVYYIDEIETPKNGSPISPFYVTLPMFVKDKGFLYNVHAYPKNAIQSLTKAVDDTKFESNELTYTMTQSVMPYQNGMSEFSVSDKLDSRLTYKSSTVTLSTGDKVKENTDYTVKVGDDNTVKLEWKNFELLNKVASASTKLTWTVTTTFANSVPKSGLMESIDNVASSIPNQDPKWKKAPLPSNKVTTVLGGIKIHKIDARTKKALAGAHFKLRNTKTNEYVKFRDGNSGKADQVDEVVTNDQGDASILDLRADSIKDYELVESKAPSDYHPLLKPIPVTGDMDANHVVSLTIKNAPRSLFFLPKTGAIGTIAATVAGLGGIFIGGGKLLRRNRKSAK